MKRILMVFLFLLVSFFSFSQSTGETWVNQGTSYYMIQSWSLITNANGPIQGGGEGVYGTPSLYWQLVRTTYPNNQGYYVYFIYFYSNSAFYNQYRKEVENYDVIMSNLVITETSGTYNNTVYSNYVYYVDRSGTNIISWYSPYSNSYIQYGTSNLSPKKPHNTKKIEMYKGHGY